MLASIRSCRVLQGALLLALIPLAGVSRLALSQDSADRLRLAALIQNGELLLQEHKSLRPAIAALERGKERLAAEEKLLLAESDAVNQGITKHNAAVDAANEAVQQQQAGCRQTEDQGKADACNARAADLRNRSDTLAKEGSEVQRRQKSVNERIGRYNAAGSEWNKLSQDISARLQPNLRDIDGWLVKMTEFMNSDSFTALSNKAGSPAACRGEPLSDSAALEPEVALERALECLRSLEANAR